MFIQLKLKKTIHVLFLLLMVSWLGGVVSAQDAITLLAPDGGEVIYSGQLYTIQWESASEAVKFNLMYSTDNGLTWVMITDGITGTCFYWDVPVLIENNNNCRLKIIGLNSSDEIMGEYISAVFIIEIN